MSCPKAEALLSLCRPHRSISRFNNCISFSGLVAVSKTGPSSISIGALDICLPFYDFAVLLLCSLLALRLSLFEKDLNDI